jgi:Sulfotransferase family
MPAAMRTPPPPPQCPDGWSAAPPDFVGVGAQRCATSWWYGLLASHPDFGRPGRPEKELHYFDRCLLDGPPDAAGYAQHFARPPGRFSGEWTPRYMFDFWTPAYLRTCAPDARLLVLLRDPVARFRSGMAAHAESMRRRRLQISPLAPGAHQARSLYWSQLDRVLAHFGRDRVLVLQYERCVASPAEEFARTLHFLGVGPYTPDAARLRARVNASDAAAALELPAEAERELRHAVAGDLRRLAADFPEIDLAGGPSATEIS